MSGIGGSVWSGICKIDLYCCECQQKLNVSTSKYDRLHFKHEPRHEYCILSDGKLTPKEIDELTQVYKAKESPRHKELKNKIGQRLLTTEGVDQSSVAVDSKFIFSEKEKRRPDVYCKYKNKELVFEIQLSTLSLRYIYGRYEFYKKKGIYLIWILDNFDIYKQGQLERDIKYLNKHQNFFKLDETSDAFRLSCQYKYPYVASDCTVMSKWITTSVLLDDIAFDGEHHEIYYYNYGENKTKRENEIAVFNAQLLEQKKFNQERRKIDAAELKACEIIHEIKRCKDSHLFNYGTVQVMLDSLNQFELSILNKKLDLNKNLDTPAIIQWIKQTKPENHWFMYFILSTTKIKFEINVTDNEGNTPLQEIYKSSFLSKFYMSKLLFKRGYILTSADVSFLTSFYQTLSLGNYELIISILSSQLKDRTLVDILHQNVSFICIIESARRNQIVGFNYKPHQWVAFAINAIQHYKEHWEYIELAFKKYGIWDRILSSDVKGTFQKKVQELFLSMPEQKFDCDELIKDLYPEIVS